MQFTLSPLHLGLLLEFCLVLSFRTCSSFSSFCLIFWVYFCVWGSLVTFLNLEKWPFVGDIWWGPEAPPRSWLPDLCSRDAPCGGRRGPSVGADDCGCAGSLDHPLAQLVARASWAVPPSPLINGAESHGSWLLGPAGHGLVLACWWEDYRLMGGLQNGLFQYQCPHAPRTSSQKRLPLGSLFPEGVSVASWLSGRLSNAREWVWSRLLSSSGPWSMWNFPCTL